MRILCLDIGSKRIGVAATDPLGITAQPKCVIERRGGAYDLSEIEGFCRELAADKIVVGVPLDEEGEWGSEARKVQAFVDILARHLKGAGLDVSIEMWDERYSTKVAEGRLIEANVSRVKRRKVIDKMAAVAILEDYLRANNAS